MTHEERGLELTSIQYRCDLEVHADSDECLLALVERVVAFVRQAVTPAAERDAPEDETDD